MLKSLDCVMLTFVMAIRKDFHKSRSFSVSNCKRKNMIFIVFTKINCRFLIFSEFCCHEIPDIAITQKVLIKYREMCRFSGVIGTRLQSYATSSHID